MPFVVYIEVHGLWKTFVS